MISTTSPNVNHFHFYGNSGDEPTSSSLSLDTQIRLTREAIESLQSKLARLERQRDREDLAAWLSKEGKGSFGHGRMPYELRHEIGKYLGGGKKRTRKSKKSKRSSKRVTRKTRKKNSRGRKTPNAKRVRKLL